LEKNNISDLSPLAKLSNLNELRLEENKISDAKPLAGLNNLFIIFLEKNPIKDKTCPVKDAVCSQKQLDEALKKEKETYDDNIEDAGEGGEGGEEELP
ncbi:MAG: leucine-rich repeat domain-containing protein, partial [Cyanobacteria bacterium J06628_3]